MPKCAHEPTAEQRAQVRALARVGVRQEMIAQAVGVTEKQLRRHYRHELDTAGVMLHAQIANKLAEQALRGNVKAQIAWMNRYGHKFEPSADPGQSNARDIARQIKEELQAIDATVPAPDDSVDA